MSPPRSRSAPLLYRQATRLRRTGRPAARAAGTAARARRRRPATLRHADRPATRARPAWARATQEEAFARPLARAVAARIAGAVSWQLVARAGLTSAASLDYCARHRSRPPTRRGRGYRRQRHHARSAAATRACGSACTSSTGCRRIAACSTSSSRRCRTWTVSRRCPQPLAWYAGLHARRAIVPRRAGLRATRMSRTSPWTA